MPFTCTECLQEDKIKYYLIPDTRSYICSDCFSKEPEKINLKNSKPKFIRLRCIVHKCSTYNPSLMAKHEMPWCDIYSEETVGVIKPNTEYDSSIGGLNGNISRTYYPDWVSSIQERDRAKHEIASWSKYQRRHKVRKENKKPSKRYAYNVRRIQQVI